MLQQVSYDTVAYRRVPVTRLQHTGRDETVGRRLVQLVTVGERDLNAELRAAEVVTMIDVHQSMRLRLRRQRHERKPAGHMMT